MFRLLFSTQTPASSSPRSRRRRLGLEGLEIRDLMAADPILVTPPPAAPAQVAPAALAFTELTTASPGLTPGQSIVSPNAQFRLTLQTDGNLVLRRADGVALWSTKVTWGQNPSRVALQPDGDFVVYGPRRADGSAPILWHTSTAGNAGATVQLRDDGNLAVISATGTTLWASNTTGTTPSPAAVPAPAPTAGLTLTPGQSVASPNGQFRLTLQTDGNLVLRRADGVAVWSNKVSWGQNPSQATMLSDGDFVIYGPQRADGSAAVLWRTGTAGNPGAVLQVRDEGRFVLMAASGTIVYNSATTSTPAPAPVTNFPGGQVGEWIRQAVTILQQLGVPQDRMNPFDIERMIRHESSGNPNAINLTDSNATNGTPSIGLMQVIQPTFNAYRLAGYNNIWNPVDNIIAGVRYAIARYGSISNTPGIVSLRNGGEYRGY